MQNSTFTLHPNNLFIAALLIGSSLLTLDAEAQATATKATPQTVQADPHTAPVPEFRHTVPPVQPANTTTHAVTGATPINAPVDGSNTAAPVSAGKILKVSSGPK